MRLAWMHPDCLSAAWLGPEDRAVFVFDEEYLDAAGWGIKRIAFVYEALLELPVEIHRGPSLQTLLRLRGETGATDFVTVDSPDPWLRQRCLELGPSLEVLPAPGFVELRGPVDLRRFSRFWSRAEAQLIR